MNLEQARDLIKNLHEQGESYATIAAKLKRQGYRSERTGKPIGPFGVGHHVRALSEEQAAPINKEKAKEPKRQGASRATWEDSDLEPLELASKVLAGELGAKERKAIARLLLNQ